MRETYVYFTGMIIDVGEKYPNGIGHFKVAQTVCPFNDDSRVRVIEDFLKAETVEGLASTGFDAIEVDVVDLHAPFVMIDQRERRAGDLIHVLYAKSLREAFREQSFACTQLAIEKDVCGHLQRFGEVAADLIGLLLRG